MDDREFLSVAAVHFKLLDVRILRRAVPINIHAFAGMHRAYVVVAVRCTHKAEHLVLIVPENFPRMNVCAVLHTRAFDVKAEAAVGAAQNAEDAALIQIRNRVQRQPACAADRAVVLAARVALFIDINGAQLDLRVAAHARKRDGLLEAVAIAHAGIVLPDIRARLVGGDRRELLVIHIDIDLERRAGLAPIERPALDIDIILPCPHNIQAALGLRLGRHVHIFGNKRIAVVNIASGVNADRIDIDLDIAGEAVDCDGLVEAMVVADAERGLEIRTGLISGHATDALAVDVNIDIKRLSDITLVERPAPDADLIQATGHAVHRSLRQRIAFRIVSRHVDVLDAILGSREEISHFRPSAARHGNLAAAVVVAFVGPDIVGVAARECEAMRPAVNAIVAADMSARLDSAAEDALQVVNGNRTGGNITDSVIIAVAIGDFGEIHNAEAAPEDVPCKAAALPTVGIHGSAVIGIITAASIVRAGAGITGRRTRGAIGIFRERQRDVADTNRMAIVPVHLLRAIRQGLFIGVQSLDRAVRKIDKEGCLFLLDRFIDVGLLGSIVHRIVGTEGQLILAVSINADRISTVIEQLRLRSLERLDVDVAIADKIRLAVLDVELFDLMVAGQDAVASHLGQTISVEGVPLGSKQPMPVDGKRRCVFHCNVMNLVRRIITDDGLAILDAEGQVLVVGNLRRLNQFVEVRVAGRCVSLRGLRDILDGQRFGVKLFRRDRIRAE